MQHVPERRCARGAGAVARVPTVGRMLRKAGYGTACKGRRHLNRECDSTCPERLFNSE